MKNSNGIYTETIINAPAQIVWDLLVDLPGYKNWNPFIPEAEGKAGLGEKLYIKPLAIAGRWPVVFTPEVYSYEPCHKLAWGQDIIHESIGGGIHSFEIKELSEDRIKFIHDEIYHGFLAPIIRNTAGIEIEKGLIAMNKGLKQAAEMQAAKVVAIP